MKKFYLVTFILSLLGLTVNLLNDYQKIELIDGDCHVFVTESKFTKKLMYRIHIILFLPLHIPICDW